MIFTVFEWFHMRDEQFVDTFYVYLQIVRDDVYLQIVRDDFISYYLDHFNKKLSLQLFTDQQCLYNYKSLELHQKQRINPNEQTQTISDKKLERNKKFNAQTTN